jgi:hypothetical protein
MTPEEIKETQELIHEINASKVNAMQSRENKIAEFKMKKMINEQMDQLKEYQDE